MRRKHGRRTAAGARMETCRDVNSEYPPSSNRLCLRLTFSSCVWNRPLIHSLTHYSLYSVYYIVNHMGNDWTRFTTLHWKFLNIIASVDASDVCVTQAGANRALKCFGGCVGVSCSFFSMLNPRQIVEILMMWKFGFDSYGVLVIAHVWFNSPSHKLTLVCSWANG